MAERYSIHIPAEVLAERFDVDVPKRYEIVYNACPTHILPVITLDNPDGLSFFYWGISPEWSHNRSISKKLINSEAEQLLKKPTLRKALTTRRCLIPADGFYAFKKIGKKKFTPYRIFLNNNLPFSMAGIWEEYENEQDEMIHTFSIVTVPASSMLHGTTDRMPAILSKEDEKLWMQKHIEPEQLEEMLKPMPNEKLSMHPVSSRLNSTDYNSPELLRPSQPQDQFGNYTLFG